MAIKDNKITIISNHGPFSSGELDLSEVYNLLKIRCSNIGQAYYKVEESMVRAENGLYSEEYLQGILGDLEYLEKLAGSAARLFVQLVHEIEKRELLEDRD